MSPGCFQRAENGNVLGEGNPFEFSLPRKEKRKIKAKGSISAREADVPSPAPPTSHQLSAEAQAVMVRLIAYPGEGYAIPAATPFKLKTRADEIDPSFVRWKIDDLEVGVGSEIQIQGLSAGDPKISATTKEFPNIVEERKITIFDWNFSLTPSSHFSLWEEKSINVALPGISKIHGQQVSPDLKPVEIGKSKIEPQLMTLLWKSESAKKMNPDNPLPTPRWERAG